jgi:hypothetical protein
MVEPLRHRQTKEAATDMFYLKPPRHISTLPVKRVAAAVGEGAQVVATLHAFLAATDRRPAIMASR